MGYSGRTDLFDKCLTLRGGAGSAVVSRSADFLVLLRFRVSLPAGDGRTGR